MIDKSLDSFESPNPQHDFVALSFIFSFFSSSFITYHRHFFYPSSATHYFSSILPLNEFHSDQWQGSAEHSCGGHPSFLWTSVYREIHREKISTGAHTCELTGFPYLLYCLIRQIVQTERCPIPYFKLNMLIYDLQATRISNDHLHKHHPRIEQTFIKVSDEISNT